MHVRENATAMSPAQVHQSFGISGCFALTYQVLYAIIAVATTFETSDEMSTVTIPMRRYPNTSSFCGSLVSCWANLLVGSTVMLCVIWMT